MHLSRGIPKRLQPLVEVKVSNTHLSTYLRILDTVKPHIIQILEVRVLKRVVFKQSELSLDATLVKEMSRLLDQYVQS